MEKSYSIEVKALLTLDNFLDAPQSVLRDNCILVTHKIFFYSSGSNIPYLQRKTQKLTLFRTFCITEHN